MLRISRTGETFTVARKGESFEGRRSVFVVDRCRLEGLERGNGYVCLPPGVYEAEMIVRAKDGMKALAFVRRLSGPGQLTKKQAQELDEKDMQVHVATKPWDLQGCFGVGVLRDHDGVMSSGEAMRILFQALGGFEEGRLVRVRIDDPKPKELTNDPPADPAGLES